MAQQFNTNGLFQKNSAVRRIGILMIVIMSFVLPGACSVKIDDYRDTRPVLDLQTYLRGELTAWGIFQSRNGEVKRYFKVNISADWSGDICTLRERFMFNDGEEQQRTWIITRHDAHHYTGTAGDVVGEARGVAQGNTLNWRYLLKVPVNGSVYKLRFDDWMYLVDDDILINRAEVTKFGFRVADVTIFFQKQ